MVGFSSFGVYLLQPLVKHHKSDHSISILDIKMDGSNSRAFMAAQLTIRTASSILCSCITLDLSAVTNIAGRLLFPQLVVPCCRVRDCWARHLRIWGNFRTGSARFNSPQPQYAEDIGSYGQVSVLSSFGVASCLSRPSRVLKDGVDAGTMLAEASQSNLTINSTAPLFPRLPAGALISIDH